MHLVGPAGASDIAVQRGAVGLRNAGAAPGSRGRECHDGEEEADIASHVDVGTALGNFELDFLIIVTSSVICISTGSVVICFIDDPPTLNRKEKDVSFGAIH